MKMEINIKENLGKKEAFAVIENFLERKHLPIASKDDKRPWGGFFKIEEAATQQFINEFFADVPVAQVRKTNKLSPKILLVEKEKRLSWQYHHRRSEIWKVAGGTVYVIISDTDEQTELQKKEPGDIIILKKGERHRLIGSDGWGIIAEIWQHTDEDNPSDEDDIVRVQDDFGR